MYELNKSLQRGHHIFVILFVKMATIGFIGLTEFLCPVYCPARQIDSKLIRGDLRQLLHVKKSAKQPEEK